MTQAVVLAQLGNSGVNFRNKIINGNFDIWQRGTSFTTAGYSADRWFTTADANSGWTLSQQAFTLGQTDVPNEPTYFMRYAISATNLTGPTVQQRIEDVRTFAGKTVTVTFYVRTSAGSTFTPNYIFMQQSFGSGGSATVNTAPVQSLVALTSSWVKHTYTFNIPSITGKTIGAGNYINIIFRIPDNTATTVDFAQFQAEEGSTPTVFEQRPIGVELALCQRYYYVLATTGGNNKTVGSGFYANSTRVDCVVTFKVSMRATPSFIQVTGTDYYAIYASNAQDNFNGFTAAGELSTEGCNMYTTSNVSGTQGAAGTVYTISPNAYLAYSAEL